MVQTLKHFFIPHAGNNYLPHILHPKRAALYSSFFVVVKLIVIIFTLSLPPASFFSPDIVAAEQVKIIRLTNALRSEKGLIRLAEVEPLNNSARARAVDMASYQYFDHEGPHHRPLEYFIAQTHYDYQTAGENLSMGSFVAEEVFRAWKNSPTHYANLIDPDYSDIGFGIQAGVYQGQTVAYAALHFGNPEGRLVATPGPKWGDEVDTSSPTPPAPKPIRKKPELALPAISTSSTTSTPNLVLLAEPLIIPLATGPMVKYERAREVFSASMPIFPISQAIYITALIIFSTALLLFVFIEIRRQHYHIIVQTLGVIGLLVTLIVV